MLAFSISVFVGVRFSCDILQLQGGQKSIKKFILPLDFFLKMDDNEDDKAVMHCFAKGRCIPCDGVYAALFLFWIQLFISITLLFIIGNVCAFSTSVCILYIRRMIFTCCAKSLFSHNISFLFLGQQARQWCVCLTGGDFTTS